MKRMAQQNINTVQYWDKRYAEADHIWNPENIVPRIAQHIQPGQSVLDVGVGSAVVLQRLNKLVPNLTFMGCDFSPRAIEKLHARKDLGFHFEVLFVYDIRKPFVDPIADVVICTETLEHIEDPEAALRNLAAMARHKIIVSVPNQESIRSPEHLWAFTIQDLRELLGRYGEPWVKHVRRNMHLLGVVTLGNNHDQKPD